MSFVAGEDIRSRPWDQQPPPCTTSSSHSTSGHMTVEIDAIRHDHQAVLVRGPEGVVQGGGELPTG
jgi:hypothetical protein